MKKVFLMIIFLLHPFYIVCMEKNDHCSSKDEKKDWQREVLDSAKRIIFQSFILAGQAVNPNSYNARGVCASGDDSRHDNHSEE